jgi:hypothetical protein
LSTFPQQRYHRFRGPRNYRVEFVKLLESKVFQHEINGAYTFEEPSNAYTDSIERGSLDFLQSKARRDGHLPPCGPNPYTPKRQVQIVIDHNQIDGR